MNFVKFLRTPLFKEHLRWLLLDSETVKMYYIKAIVEITGIQKPYILLINVVGLACDSNVLPCVFCEF